MSDPARQEAARRRIVVTGAGGMLGRAVVEALAGRHEVVPMRRADGDLVDPQRTLEWIAARSPQAVVHCAAWTDVDGCEGDPERAERENGLATENAARAARAAGAALCYLSTDYVFDGQKPGAYLEDDAVAPLNVYGRSKRHGEEHVLRHVERSWVVRTSWLFGPGGRNFVRTMAGLMRRQEVVRVVDDQVGSPTYTRDLAVALRALVESDRYGIYHITNAGTCSWYEFAGAIASGLGSRCRVEPCRSADFPRPAARPRNSVLENRRYRASGFPPLGDWHPALHAYLQELEREVER